MNYTVAWPDAIINELARQYVLARHAGFRTAFTQAVHRAEQRLSDDPFKDTESRGATSRVLIEPPVTVYYRIEPDRRQVTIIDVLFARPRGH
jgi:hypothetical protein